METSVRKRDIERLSSCYGDMIGDEGGSRDKKDDIGRGKDGVRTG